MQYQELLKVLFSLTLEFLHGRLCVQYRVHRALMGHKYTKFLSYSHKKKYYSQFSSGSVSIPLYSAYCSSDTSSRSSQLRK